MELDQLSLELGIGFPDTFLAESQERILDSDSDYSSNGNEINSCGLLFPDADLYSTTNINYNEGNCPEDEVDSSLDEASFNEEFTILSNKPAIKGNSTSIQRKAPVSMKVGPNDSVKHHDYALPVSLEAESHKKPLSIFKPSVDLKKLLSLAQIDNSESTISNRLLKSPTEIEKRASVSKYSDLENTNMTKNAIAARENRLKKKQYIHTLEISVKELSSENEILKQQVVEKDANILAMSNELKYLRSVLLNVDEISSLVKDIKTLPTFQGEGLKRRISVEEHNKTVLSKKCKIDKSCSLSSKVLSGTPADVSTERPGICVHVRGSSLSLELCHHCSNKSSSKN